METPPKDNPDEPITDQAVEPAPPAAPESESPGDEDVGDFINRHVLEKDSVFFEG